MWKQKTYILAEAGGVFSCLSGKAYAGAFYYYIYIDMACVVLAGLCQVLQCVFFVDSWRLLSSGVVMYVGCALSAHAGCMIKISRTGWSNGSFMENSSVPAGQKLEFYFNIIMLNFKMTDI